MAALKDKLVYGAAGAASGLAGIFPLPGCPGGPCISCFGCLAAGAGIVLMALLNKSNGKKENHHGMAQNRN